MSNPKDRMWDLSIDMSPEWKKEVMRRIQTYAVRRGECWEWTGGRDTKGYGIVRVFGRRCTTHRASYAALIGTIPTGLFICHTSDNKVCVLPAHMYLATAKDNVRDAIERGQFAPVLAAIRVNGERWNASRRKLTDSQVLEVRDAWETERNLSALGRKFGVSPATVRRIVRREVYQWI